MSVRSQGKVKEVSRLIDLKDRNGRSVVMPNRAKTNAGETHAEAEMRNAEISEMYLQGLSYDRISKAMTVKYGKGYSINTICYRIKALLNRWQTTYLENINSAMVEELTKLNNLESTYWEAWLNSLKNKETIEEFKVTGSDGSGEEKEGEKKEEEKRGEADVDGENGKKKSMRKKGAFIREKRFVRVEGSYGDVNFLMGIERCIEKRCKILGLFQDTRTININWRDEARKEGYDPDEIVDGMAQVIIERNPNEEPKLLEPGEESK